MIKKGRERRERSDMLDEFINCVNHYDRMD